MNNWRTIQLGDYYEFSSGLSKSADQFGFGFPFLSFSDVFWNYFIPNELSNLVNSNKKERNSCSVKQGDVFLTRTSETEDELGMSCVALKDYPEATFNGFTKRLRPKNQGEIDPIFIGFYMRSPYFRAQISAYSNIITRASLNNDILGRLKIIVPQYEAQKKIGEALIKFTRLIENNNQRIMLLEEMAEEIYKEWFVRMRFPGYEMAKFVNDEGEEVPIGTVGALPVGWKEKPINSIIDIISGYAFKTESFDSEGIYKLVTIKNVQDGFFVTETSDYIKELPKNLKDVCKLKDKDIVLSLTGNIGRICIVYGENYLLNQRVAKLNPKKAFLYEFSYMMFRSKFLRTTLENLSNGAAQQNLSPIEMGKLEFPVPSEDILKQFSELTKSVFDEIIILNKKNQLLQQTRDLLLPRLISGKLSVEHLIEEVVHLPMAAEPEVTFNTKRSS